MPTAELPDPRRAHGWRPILVLLAVVLAVGLAAVAVAARLSTRDSATGSCRSGAVDSVDLVAAGEASAAQLEDAAGILRARLGAYGCADVSVHGDRLRVSARSATMAHLEELLAPGELQFREVLETVAASPSAGCVLAAPGTPPDTRIDQVCSKDRTERYRLGPAEVVSTDLKGATAQQDQQLGQWQIIVSFTDSGQRKFTDLTSRLIGKQLAIVLDGYVLSSPSIQERIDGDAQITGSFTKSSANALARILEHGTLPVQLKRA